MAIRFIINLHQGEMVDHRKEDLDPLKDMDRVNRGINLPVNLSNERPYIEKWVSCL